MAKDDVVSPPTPTTTENGTAAATDDDGGGVGEKDLAPDPDATISHDDTTTPSTAPLAAAAGGGGMTSATTKRGVDGGARRPPPPPPPAGAERFRTPTLFVGGLHPRVADVHLHKLFGNYGTVHRVHRPTFAEGPRVGQPRGYAFVEFASSGERGGVESARMAAADVDGRMLLGRTLAVRPAHDRTGGDVAGGDGAHAADGATGGSVVDAAKPDPRLVRKEKSEVQAKIDAVRRAIEERKKKRQKR